MLFKSGAIKMASLVELWTNWASYVDAEEPKPSFEQLYHTDLNAIDAAITKRKKFCKVLQKLAAPFRSFFDVEIFRPSSLGKPTSIMDVYTLDQELDKKRQEKKWISGPALNMVWYLAIAPFLIYLVSAILLLGPILAIPLIVIMWVVKIRQELSYRRFPRHAVPTLKSIKNRVSKNLRKWSDQDLATLAGLVAALPTWQPDSPAAEKTSDTGTRPEPTRDRSIPYGRHNTSPPPMGGKQPAKTKISAKAVVQDIRTGMNDVGLMQKYGLSAKQLTALYKKLDESGLLKKA